MSHYENILKESVDTIQIVRDELKLDPVANLFKKFHYNNKIF